jgi:hypothetical protein
MSFTFDKQTTMPSGSVRGREDFWRRFHLYRAGTCATQSPGHVFKVGDCCSMNEVCTSIFRKAGMVRGERIVFSGAGAGDPVRAAVAIRLCMRTIQGTRERRTCALFDSF